MIKTEVAAPDEVYRGKKVTVKVFELSQRLITCFNAPDRTLAVVNGVQEALLSLIPLDPRGRVMFDYEVEDTRDELELMEAAEAEEEGAKSEHAVDFRPPSEIVEELIQTLMLLIERQPAAAHKVVRLVVLCLSLENEGLASRALSQMLDFLEAGGSYAALAPLRVGAKPLPPRATAAWLAPAQPRGWPQHSNVAGPSTAACAPRGQCTWLCTLSRSPPLTPLTLQAADPPPPPFRRWTCSSVPCSRS